MSNQINRGKASSHPLIPGAVYEGVVKFHGTSSNQGLPTIFVEQLGVTFTEVQYVGNSSRHKYKVGDQVLCTFTNLETNKIFILGAFSKKIDVYAGKDKFNSLIDEIEARLNLSATALESFKQVD